MSELEKIGFTGDDGQVVELYVWAETTINGVNYLLVSETDDEDAECCIFKETKPASRADNDTKVSKEEEVSYEPVEEDDELDYIGRIFEELLSEDEEE